MRARSVRFRKSLVEEAVKDAGLGVICAVRYQSVLWFVIRSGFESTSAPGPCPTRSCRFSILFISGSCSGPLAYLLIANRGVEPPSGAVLGISNPVRLAVRSPVRLVVRKRRAKYTAAASVAIFVVSDMVRLMVRPVDCSVVRSNRSSQNTCGNESDIVSLWNQGTTNTYHNEPHEQF